MIGEEHVTNGLRQLIWTLGNGGTEMGVQLVQLDHNARPIRLLVFDD